MLSSISAWALWHDKLPMQFIWWFQEERYAVKTIPAWYDFKMPRGTILVILEGEQKRMLYWSRDWACYHAGPRPIFYPTLPAASQLLFLRLALRFSRHTSCYSLRRDIYEFDWYWLYFRRYFLKACRQQICQVRRYCAILAYYIHIIRDWWDDMLICMYQKLMVLYIADYSF